MFFFHTASENSLSVYLAAFSEVKDMKVVRECMRLQEKIYPEYFSSLLIGTDASLSLKTNYNWDLLKKTLQNCDELKSVTLMKQEGMYRFYEKDVANHTVR